MTLQPLHYFPDYSAGNPYQAMLHQHLDEVGARAVPVPALLAFLDEAASRSDPGVLALHWTAPVLRGARGPFRAALLLDRFSDALDSFVTAGGRLVWTVHNVLPHETLHRWAEIELAQLLADRARLVHVLTPATFDAVRPWYRLDARKTVVIEHSSYQGVYPDDISRAEARARLGVGDAETALLALGLVRPYKGLDSLVENFQRLADADPFLRLLVAGHPSEGSEVAELVDRCERDPRIVTRFEHISDDDLQVWLRAADISVLPYRQILNSGAFLLAQTFGLSVVAPAAGSLRSAQTLEHVTTFAPDLSGSLADAIAEAVARVRRDPAAQRSSALAAADARPPERMARAYAQAVAPLLRDSPT